MQYNMYFNFDFSPQTVWDSAADRFTYAVKLQPSLQNAQCFLYIMPYSKGFKKKTSQLTFCFPV